MLDNAVRKTFINLIGRYHLTQTRCQLKSNEIRNMAERIGGYTDSDILVQVIMSVPFESPLRYALFRKYHELTEKASEESDTQSYLKKTASLDKWTKNTLKRLAAEYKLFLDGKTNLEEEISGLAEECGANDNIEDMNELISLVNFQSFVRFRLVNRQIMLKEKAQGIERPVFTMEASQLM